MNPRIKELAEKAGMVIVNDEFSTYGKFAEKFAELIIAAVIDIAEDQRNYNSSIYTTYDRDRAKGIIADLVKSIKQQLG
jgi:hypothetical protein